MIYLDNHATTPCDQRVVDAMLPYFTEHFANPSGGPHIAATNAKKGVETARRQIAELINAEPAEILFTSGATESNNLAIMGLARGVKRHTDRRGLVSTQVEHKAVLEPLEQLEREGFNVTVLGVTSTGRVNVAEAARAITPDTLLVSLQVANNEVGTLQPVQELANLTRTAGALCHTDAAQAAGRVTLDVRALDVDLLSLSSHKMYGPKGVGVLFVRGGPRSLPFEQLIFGGAQENRLRPGTPNVPGIVGMGAAAQLCCEILNEESCRLAGLRDTFEKVLLRTVPNAQINRDEKRLPNNSSVTIKGIDAEALLVSMPELALSTGSACNHGAPEPSFVLSAMGLSRQDAYSTFRVGFGRFNTMQDVSEAVALIARAAELQNEFMNKA